MSSTRTDRTTAERRRVAHSRGQAAVRRRVLVMAVGFAVGSACFVVAPFPAYLQLVGERADAITFFVGSIFFTLAGVVQTVSAWPGRRTDPGGWAAWWSAAVQSAGT